MINSHGLDLDHGHSQVDRPYVPCTTQVTFQNIDCDVEFGGIFGKQGAQCKTCGAGSVFRKDREEAGPLFLTFVGLHSFICWKIELLFSFQLRKRRCRTDPYSRDA